MGDNETDAVMGPGRLRVERDLTCQSCADRGDGQEGSKHVRRFLEPHSHHIFLVYWINGYPILTMHLSSYDQQHSMTMITSFAGT